MFFFFINVIKPSPGFVYFPVTALMPKQKNSYRQPPRSYKSAADASSDMQKHNNANSASLGGNWLFGYHPVTAALKNPARSLKRLLVTKETAAELNNEKLLPDAFETVARSDLDRILPKGAVHQGIAALFSALPDIGIEDIDFPQKAVVVILDQVTDPHNVGAVLRSAAAFDASAVILTDRNAPEATGTLAKSASGTLELVPLIAVSNLTRAMKTLKELGFWCVGLDGRAPSTLRETSLPDKIALVMGSEGFGLRRLTAENCDYTVKLPISERVESLNVSNAAAIALYEMSLRKNIK